MKLRKSIIILCLITSGVNPKRIETISYGMERPLDPAHNEEAWAKNRRDNFVINNSHVEIFISQLSGKLMHIYYLLGEA